MKRFVLITCYTLGVFIFGLTWAIYKGNIFAPSSSSRYTLQVNRLRRISNTSGIESAYTDLKTNARSKSLTSVHMLAHWIGAEAYLKLGTKGISICDDAFSWGCYHGFFGSALAREGDSGLHTISKACQQLSNGLSYGGCVHGIGHGVLSYSGYEFSNLEDALQTCLKLTPEGVKIGCYNGTFMEYNSRLMRAAESGQASSRIFDSAHPYDPCDRLDKVFQSDCYYEQPDWWISVLKNDYNQMIQLCSGVPEISNKQRCFAGIGRMLGSLQKNNPNMIVQTCMSSDMPDDALSCVTESIRILLSQGNDRAVELCTSLQKPYVQRCEQDVEVFRCNALGLCK